MNSPTQWSDGGDCVGGGEVDKGVALLIAHPLRIVNHVFARIAVVGNRDVVTEKLHVAGIEGLGKFLELASAIIELVTFKVEVINQKEEVVQRGNWEMLVQSMT